MTTVSNIEPIPLSEIRDLMWPTDDQIVEGFIRMIQSGHGLPVIEVNRVWHDDASWHYEIIDGFHRYRAAKDEHLDALTCRVSEYSERDARYLRIQATLDKPTHVIDQRAKLEFRMAFISDVLSAFGDPSPLFEPIIDDEGNATKRERKGPLPDDPFQAIGILMDHLTVVADERAANVLSPCLCCLEYRCNCQVEKVEVLKTKSHQRVLGHDGRLRREEYEQFRDMPAGEYTYCPMHQKIINFWDALRKAEEEESAAKQRLLELRPLWENAFAKWLEEMTSRFGFYSGDIDKLLGKEAMEISHLYEGDGYLIALRRIPDIDIRSLASRRLKSDAQKPTASTLLQLIYDAKTLKWNKTRWMQLLTGSPLMEVVRVAGTEKEAVLTKGQAAKSEEVVNKPIPTFSPQPSRPIAPIASIQPPMPVSTPSHEEESSAVFATASTAFGQSHVASLTQRSKTFAQMLRNIMAEFASYRTAPEFAEFSEIFAAIEKWQRSAS